MIVIDSSVLVAIVKTEPDHAAWVERIAPFDRRLISAATWFETTMVCDGQPEGSLGEIFDGFVRVLGLQIVSLTPDHAQLARIAFNQYGKGRKNKARLNFGDCFSYALAKALDAPLLFKGDDFSQTDVRRA
jgi:ribonuclease VapC